MEFMKKFIFVIFLCFIGTVSVLINKYFKAEDFIDYGRSFYMPGENDGNNLYISITGRMKIQSDYSKRDYIAVKDHPRENTFNDDIPAYSNMVKTSGASFIGFVFNQTGDAVISRRSNLPTSNNFQSQCINGLYSNVYRYSPRKVKFTKELVNIDEIRKAALDQKRILVKSSYFLDGNHVTLEYQAGLINFKSDSLGGVRYWQLVSDIVPMYAGGDLDQCGSIKQGYISVRNFAGSNQAIFLCGDQKEGAHVSINDYKCVIDLEVRSRFFVEIL